MERLASPTLEQARREIATLRGYLATLGDIALAGEVPLDDLLQRIVDSARDLLQARYAALGVFDARGKVRQFYTSGLTAEERARIGSLPVGAGLLGLIVRERRIVRVPRIADHPASVGFPPNHPPMTSFLGGPIARGEVVYGNLYLTDRIGAEEFSEEDAELLALLARQSALAIENARRFTRARQEERTTRALFDLGKALSALDEPARVIELVVRSALTLLGADVAGLGLPTADQRYLRWVLLRRGVDQLCEGTLAPAATSLAGRVLGEGLPFECADVAELDLPPGDNPLLAEEQVRSLVLVPLGSANERGVLTAGWRAPDAVVDGAQEVLIRLADRAAIALAQAELRTREQEALRQTRIERASLEAIFDSLQDAVITADLDGKIVRLNRKARVWAEREAIGRPFAEVFPLVDSLGQSVGGDGPSASEVTLVRSPGEWIPVEYTVSPIEDPPGQVVGTIRVLRDLRPQREVEQLKANIISLVSHELRTPLSHIKGYASTLLQPDVTWDAATQRDFLASIERQADRLARLISDLLEISQLDAGGTSRLERQVVAPATLVERGLRQAAPNAVGHPIETLVPPGLPPVLADPGHVERVLSNLIENAAKYSPEGAPIRVSAQSDGAFVTFAVHDAGPGLTLEERSHLFERFYRSPRVKHRTPGTGLGLAICKEIVQAHGGTIWAESVEGQGSIFRFTLPRAP